MVESSGVWGNLGVKWLPAGGLGQQNWNTLEDHSGDDFLLERLVEKLVSGVNNGLFVPSRSES